MVIIRTKIWNLMSLIIIFMILIIFNIFNIFNNFQIILKNLVELNKKKFS